MKYLALMNVMEGQWFTLSRTGQRFKRIGWPNKGSHTQFIYYGTVRCFGVDGSDQHLLSSKCKVEKITGVRK